MQKIRTVVSLLVFLPALAAQADLVQIPFVKAPTRHQGSLGVCYAVVAAEMIDSVLYANSPDSASWNSSTLYLASNYATRLLPASPEANRVVASIRSDALLGNVSGAYVPPFSEKGQTKTGVCSLSSSMTVGNGGYMCRTYNAFVKNKYRLCGSGVDSLAYTAAPSTKSDDEGQVWSWAGSAPSSFEKCRIELSTEGKGGASAVQYATEGADNPLSKLYFSDHFAFKRLSSCRKLWRQLEVGGAHWGNEYVEGEEVGQNSPFSVSACFSEALGGTANCTSSARRHLVAMTKLLYKATNGLDVYSKFLSTMCTMKDARAALEPYSCRTYQIDANKAWFEFDSETFEDMQAVRLLRIAMIEKIKATLRSKLAVAVSLHLQKLMAHPFPGLDSSTGDRHEVAIVGYESFPSGTVYRIRNSWGKTCDNGSYNWDRDGITCNVETGDRWVPENILLEAAYEVSFLSK